MSKPNKQKYNNNYKKASTNQPKPVSLKVASPPKPVDFSKPITLTFNATDTLFFRESRPMESMGELQSVFPPPMRTLAGAIRTLIGETNGVNWQDYERNPQDPIRQLIGYSDDLGALQFEGAWLAWEEKGKGKRERLYPAPLHLLKKDDKLHRLELDPKGIWCDLGKKVRLPKLPSNEAKGSKPLENTWLTRAGFESVLNGETPTIDQLKTAKDLFERESRLGIARDNATRSVQEGMLYQTQHIRPHADLSIEVDVTGLPDTMPQNAIIRMGGEGRSASLSVKQANNTLPKGKAGTGIALYLLTPLNMPQGAYLGFIREERDTQTVWTGTLNGIALELHGAVTGKALREGGWDMANRQPRAVTSLIPAGSVFFCKVVNGDTATAINALHNQHIGTLTAYGYGHLAVGVWNDQ